MIVVLLCFFFLFFRILGSKPKRASEIEREDMDERVRGATEVMHASNPSRFPAWETAEKRRIRLYGEFVDAAQKEKEKMARFEQSKNKNDRLIERRENVFDSVFQKN